MIWVRAGLVRMNGEPARCLTLTMCFAGKDMPDIGETIPTERKAAEKAAAARSGCPTIGLVISWKLH